VDKLQILLTNDDGIRSPGLWAAAAALSALGYVTVVAPREQSSGMGRSLPITSDGVILVETMVVNGQEWTVHAVGGTPAQAVQHALLEVMPQPPDLVVSGINYGENLASGITISGTVGAALEAASMNIPALAVSLETEKAHHLSYSTEVDFSHAAQITLHFARLTLERGLPGVAQVLKIDIPSSATLLTPWAWTRVSHQRYYMPVPPQRERWDQPGKVGYDLALDWSQEPEDTDVYTLLKKRQISVCPLQLDLTAPLTKAEQDTFAQN